MKLIFRTFALLVVLLLIAFLGRYVNALTLQKISEKNIQKDAQLQLNIFVKNVNPNKKTVVVIGTSSSLYSYVEDTYYPGKGSYADLLKKKANVINLSSHDLFNTSEVKVLINFAKKSIPKIDLIILENLRYLHHEEFIMDELDLAFVLVPFCKKEYFTNSTLIKDFSTNRFSYSEQCNLILHDLFNIFQVAPFYTNPCLKKYEEKLRFNLLQPKEERVRILSEILRCRQDFFNPNQVVLELADRFHYAHFQDLEIAFSNVGLNLYSLDEHHYIQEYSPLDVILTDRYLRDISKNNKDTKFVVIPNPSKKINNMKDLPIFKNTDKVLLLEVSSEISNIKNAKKLKFGEIFLDGAHSKQWVHQLLADKIISQFLN